MVNHELLANLQKTMERTSSSTSSGKDIERALVQTLEDWIEEQLREGKTAIQDILASLTLRFPIPSGGDTCYSAAFPTAKSVPLSVPLGMTPSKVENKENVNNDDNAAFNPHHNEDMLFRFEEESPPSPRRRDSINDDKDNEDQQDQDEENTVPDSYLPSQYGSVPINITRPFGGLGSGNAAIKRGTKSKSNAADADKAPFEPPHEYYARTYQQTDAFERPSVSVRKQSLI